MITVAPKITSLVVRRKHHSLSSTMISPSKDPKSTNDDRSSSKGFNSNSSKESIKTDKDLEESEIDSFTMNASKSTPLPELTLKEGDDVSIKCVIRSHPPVNRILWFMNGYLLYSSPSTESSSSTSSSSSVEGITVSNDTLFFDPVAVHHEGSISCAASNEWGRSKEGLLQLKVLRKLLND